MANMGCAQNPKIQFVERKNNAAIVQFNFGPLIERVNINKVMKDYCGSLTPKVIKETEIQLPGQYRFQKKVEFICDAP